MLKLDDIQSTFTKENTEELFDNKESAIRFLEELPQWIQQERAVSQLCDDWPCKLFTCIIKKN